MASRLSETIQKIGVNQFLFLVPMRPLNNVLDLLISYTSTSDEEMIIPCYISEETHKVEKDYKITLESIYEGFGSLHFYIADLQSMIDKGTVTMYNCSL